MNASTFGQRPFRRGTDAALRARATRSGLLAALLTALAFASHAPAQPVADLHAAVRSGDVARLEAALSAGAGGANRADSWGRTPLIVALQQGRTDMARMLLERGASVAATDAWGRTPLLVATQLKNTEAIGLLLARGPDVNAANRNDITPLIAAAQTGNHEAVALLLAARANPDLADNLGWTALMWAVYRKDAVIANLLLDHGANASVTGRDRSTAPAMARSRGADAALVARLESAAQPAAAGTAGMPASRPGSAADAAGAKLFPLIEAGRIIRGSPKAALTIVEYTDFQCPYCRQGAQVLDEVLARYEGEVRLIVKHLPLPLLHPMALPCARYFEALYLQRADLAWAFYERVFRDQRALAGGEPYLRKVALELGADPQRLDEDARSAAVRDRIEADLKEAEQFKFDGVPVFVVDGELIAGAQPAESFFRILEASRRR